MHGNRTAALLLFACVGGSAAAQEPARVDFARDVRPLLKSHCVECHGPKQQKNGLRLDRRRDVMQGGTQPLVASGNSEASKLYLRLVSDRFGTQMPPEGTMTKEEIKVIKAWIDQGAKWPDDASGETPAVPADPQATRLMELIRSGDRDGFLKALTANPAAVKRTGPDRSTPLMFAVLYGNAADVKAVLDAGADPNAKNEVGATALLWAADDVEKTRLLLKAKADPNVRSEDGRTALLAATYWAGKGDVARLLLEHGADPSAVAHSYRGPTMPLRQAADHGDAAVVRMLLDSKAKPGPLGFLAAIAALNSNSPECVDQLIESADPKAMATSLLFLVPPRGNPAGFGNTDLMKKAIALGADVNAKDEEGRSVLMLAAGSEAFSPETIRLLLEKGANVRAKSIAGETALDFAKRGGRVAVIDLLTRAGAETGAPAAKELPKPRPAASARAAVERSLPLLQKTDAVFTQKSGCISCHNNSLTAMTVSAAGKAGIAVDEKIAKTQMKATADFVEVWRERTLQAWPVPGDAATASYYLVGLAAGNHAPDPATDAWSRYLKNRQAADGRWSDPSHRPPLEASDFQATATSLRAIKVYAPAVRRAEYDGAVRKAADWLAKSRPTTTEDRAFQLLGLKWAGSHEDAIRAAARDFIAEQRPDGGWGQHAAMASDAYATGEALAALHEVGAVTTNDPSYKRGTQFLLSTQLEDGSWYVKSRSIPFQPYFESGFPHGHDQWISAAATNWAVMGLIPAAK